MGIEILQRIQDISGYVAGTLTAIATIGTFGYKYGKKWYYRRKEHTKRQQEMADKINIIFSELTPNHGSSLKDKVNNIDEKLVENTVLTKDNSAMLKVVTARQQWILDMQTSPIFESDCNGLCTWVNDAYIDIIKRSKEEILGHGWKNFIHEDDRERVVNEWDNAVAEQRSSQSSYRIVSKDGKIYEVECYAVKHKDNGYTGNLKIK
jgi:PAS domain S-box-containing protein